MRDQRFQTLTAPPDSKIRVLTRPRDLARAAHGIHVSVRVIVSCSLWLLVATSPALWAVERSGVAEPDGGQETQSWRDSLGEMLRSSFANLDEFADANWRRFFRHMGFHEPRHIAAYRGYGNDRRLWLRGRLLANKPAGGPKDDDNWWDNLKATYQRWESDEVPNAVIELFYAGKQQTVVTDNEGYYEATFEVDKNTGRRTVVRAEHTVENRVLSALHDVFVPQADAAEYLIISDLDDTVIHTGITDLLVSAQLTFLNNAKTRKPLAGVGSLYRALARGKSSAPVNPVIYVSNSAWNMYDLLRDFLDLNDLPPGPLLLRDIGRESKTSNHKIDTIRALLTRYPSLPVVLIGDSGQHDAEIYATIANEFPNRVRAVYIRDIDPEKDSEYDGKVDRIIERTTGNDVPFLRVGDSREVAAHAAELGLLPKTEIREIAADANLDRERETVADELGKP